MKNPLTTFRRRIPGSFQSLRDMENEMERLFRQSPFDWGSEFDEMGFAPACTIKENKKEFLYKLDIPGIKKDDVKIEFENNRLTISGERKEEKEEKDARHYLSETYYGSFVRSFNVPGSIDEDKIDAHYEDGVLTVKVPKLEATKAKEVKVH